MSDRKFTYLPFLRTKTGEANAIEHLASSTQANIIPIFNVVGNAHSLFCQKIAASRSGLAAGVDGLFSFNASNSIASFAGAFSGLGAGGVRVLPCFEVNGPQTYTLAVLPFVNQYASGLFLRSTPGNLPSALAFAQHYNFSPADIDLIVDAGQIEYDPVSFAGYIQSVFAIAQQNAWRSLTFLGSSAPKDFGGLTTGTQVVPRIEWQTWRVLQSLGTNVHFSDYSVAHRDLSEPPGFAMANATVSVRYTVDNEWIMIKGRSTRGQFGQPMGNQYRQHAQALAARPDFNGLTSCWADDEILAISAGRQELAIGQAG